MTVWRRNLVASAVTAGLVVGFPAVALAPVTSRLSADQILAETNSGQSAAAVLRVAFPSASIRTTGDVPVRVLVADLAPRVIVAAHGHPAFILRGQRIRLVADHRYEVGRWQGGWTVRDLDGARTTRRLAGGSLRIVAGVANATVLLADPLGRRFRGALELRRGEHRTISVVNHTRLERWAAGAVGGELPKSWLSSPRAIDLAAILERSRALAAIRAQSHGWDLTSDDPLYLGIDGEQPQLRPAAERTRGQAAWLAGAPLDGAVSLVNSVPALFTPDPGLPRKVALAPARPIPGAPVGLGPRAVVLAQQQLGTPYVWGGKAPGGFDCSGLVWWVYGQLGIRLPRVAEDQGAVGVPVADRDLLPGDVVFFADSSGYVHHEGINIGGGMMIHAPQTGDVVKVQRFDTGYYARQYAGARRFSPVA